MSDPTRERPADYAEQAHAEATAALQAICLERNIRLAPDLSRDIVCLLASRELMVWQALEEAGELAEKLTASTAEAKDHMAFLKRAMDYTTRVQRYWRLQFCPVCWLWTGALWLLGLRGPTAAQADHVKHGD